MRDHPMRARRAISIVEAGYTLGGGDTAWLGGILDAAAPDLDGGGALAFTSRWTHGRLEPQPEVASRGMGSRQANMMQMVHTMPDAFMELAARSAVICGGVIESTVAHPELRAHSTVLGDGFVLFAQDGERWGVNVSALYPVQVRVAPGVRRVWQRVGVHLAAGMRLRRKLADQAAPVDAVVEPGGALVHAEGAVRGDARIRKQLTAAVHAADRARSRRLRAEPEQAMGLWCGLVAGTWSLVDRWEADGRRYVAAYRNPPQVRDPRALTSSLRIALEYVGLGCTNKEIAYTLGVSTAAVAQSVSALLRRLRCRTRTELVAMAHPDGASEAQLRLGPGDTLGVLSWPTAPRPEVMHRLTRAEQEVARLAAAGSSNAAIARQRGASANTVANQLRGIYAKLGVSSRAQLARVLLGAQGARS